MLEALTAPPLLTPGCCVAVVAPSGPVATESCERGMALLGERYDVCVRPDIAARHGYLAGRDARRARELQDAIDDPDVRAIFVMRGGYGSMRLLDRLRTDTLRTHPKWLIGYSDATALHARWALAGVQSLHGPVVREMAVLDDTGQTQLFAALETGAPPVFDNLRVLHAGEAAGPLLGGNLSILCALLGTADLPPLDGAVLLLEEVNEEPYKVDRMLTQLHRAGVLERVTAVALGWFADSSPGEDGVTVEQVLAERLGGLRYPVVAGLPVGHGGVNVPIRLGAVVRVAGDRLIGEERAVSYNGTHPGD